MKVLFVCTGNTCRSPMAAALWAQMGGEADSAGLSAREGEDASRQACTVMAERGIDLTCHSAKTLNAAQVREAGIIVPMSEGHGAAILRRYPEAAGKIRFLGPVPDPYGGDEDVYRRCADTLWEKLTALREAL